MRSRTESRPTLQDTAAKTVEDIADADAVVDAVESGFRSRSLPSRLEIRFEKQRTRKRQKSPKSANAPNRVKDLNGLGGQNGIPEAKGTIVPSGMSALIMVRRPAIPLLFCLGNRFRNINVWHKLSVLHRNQGSRSLSRLPQRQHRRRLLRTFPMMSLYLRKLSPCAISMKL